MTRKISQVEVVRLFLKNSLRPLDIYVNNATPLKSECLKCKNIVYPMLTNIKQKNGGCMYCATRGIDFNKPAYLYLITNDAFNAHKVGVGNSGENKKNDRITKFKKYGWQVHKRWDFENGSMAFGYEQLVLKHLRKELKIPIFMTLDLMKETGGHSETVGADSITLLELEKIIKKVIKGYRNADRRT